MLLDIQKAKSQKEVAEFFARKADELSGTGRGLFSLMQEGVVERLYQALRTAMQYCR